MTYLKHLRDGLTLQSVITKLIASFALVSLTEILFADNSFQSAEFFNSISIVYHLLVIALVFVILNILSTTRLYNIIEPFFVVLVVLCLFTATNMMAGNFYFALISSAVMGGLIFYYAGKMKHIDISKKLTIILCAVFGLLFVLFVGGLTILRYLNHWTPNYDFGIFSQMFHYMKETFIPNTTTERDRLLSHFAVHFSPIYYLILPFYMIFPSPATLLAIQAIAVALGIIPLYKLAKHYKLSNIAVVFVIAIYLLLPALIGGNFFYFHENKFLTVLLLWLFYFIEKNKNFPTAVFTLLVMMVKEDAPVYIVFIGLYLLFSNRNKRKGGILICVAIIYFGVVTTLMSLYGEGIMAYRYKNYIFGNDDSLFLVVVNVIKNPAYMFEQILTADKLVFLIYMLVPLGMLPLAIKKPARLILLFPMLLINIMTNYVYQYDIKFQYTYGTSAFLFYLIVMNLSDLPRPIAKKLLVSALSASIIFFAATHVNKFGHIESYLNDRPKIEAINKGLALVPKDKSVKASTFLVVPLSDRKELYQYEYTKHTTEYVVLDLRYFTNEYNVDDYQNDRYEEIYYVEDIIAIYRLKNPPS